MWVLLVAALALGADVELVSPTCPEGRLTVQMDRQAELAAVSGRTGSLLFDLRAGVPRQHFDSAVYLDGAGRWMLIAHPDDAVVVDLETGEETPGVDHGDTVFVGDRVLQVNPYYLASWKVGYPQAVSKVSMSCKPKQLALSPDKKRVLVHGSCAETYDVATLKRLQRWELPGALQNTHTPGFQEGAFAPDGTAFVSDGTTLWDLSSGVKEVYRNESFDLRLANHPDGVLVGGGWGGPAVWTGGKLRGHVGSSPSGIAASGLGTTVFASDYGAYADQPDITLCTRSDKRGTALVFHGNDLIFTPLGIRVSLRTGIQEVLADRPVPLVVPIPADKPLIYGQTSSDMPRYGWYSTYTLVEGAKQQLPLSGSMTWTGETMVGAGASGEVIEVDPRTGQVLRTIAPGPGSWDVAVSPDGKTAALSAGLFAEPRGVRLWDFETGKAGRKLRDLAENSAISFSADGTGLIAKPEEDKGVAVVKTRGSGTYSHHRFGPRKAILLAFSADRQWVALYGDGKLYVEPVTGRDLGERTSFEVDGGIGGAGFSEDGRLFALVSRMGEILIVGVPDRNVVARGIVQDGEIVWFLPSGFYTGSPGALRNLGMRIDGGVFTFEQVDPYLNRPDKVLEAFGYATDEELAQLRRARDRRLRRGGIDDVPLPQLDPPRLAWVEVPPSRTSSGSVALNVRIEPRKRPVSKLVLYVDDVPVYGESGIEARSFETIEKSLSVDLVHGVNRIQVSAVDEQGLESFRLTAQVERTGNKTKPSLHVVAIGISDYENDEKDLEFAAKDADDLGAFFRDNGGAFANVLVHKAVDTGATRSAILGMKTKLQASRPEDVVVLFVAGHGVVTSDLEWYLAPHEMDFAEPDRAGVSYDELEGLLDGIPARRKLMLIDACHSGELDPDEAQLAAVDPRVGARGFRGLAVVAKTKGVSLDALYGDLFADTRRTTGAAVISSSAGAEFSFEDEIWNNGVFTYALLTALDANKHLGVVELRDQVATVVSALTDGLQTPTLRRQNLSLDFDVLRP